MPIGEGFGTLVIAIRSSFGGKENKVTTKDIEMIAEPWKVWPDGIIPAEGNRPAWKLRTPEEARRWLADLAKSRESCQLSDDISVVESIRQERDER